MADLSEAQRKRAKGRQRRREQAGPEPDPAGTAKDAGSDGAREDSHHAVVQAAKVAAVAGAAGAVAAAARALNSRDNEDEEEARPQHPAPESAADPDEHDQPVEPESEHEPDAPEQEEQQERMEQQAGQDEQEGYDEPVVGAQQGEARQVLERARDQLEDLLGRPVESVSSLERTHDGWVLALEVVELRRIPESTDVLASYEMELDDDLNLRRYRQGRRYHRARADGEEL